jgi:integrase
LEDDEAKAMSRDELAEMLALVPAQWHLFFWFLAATGVRISEAIALQWRHLEIHAPIPHVKVRRAPVKGRMGRRATGNPSERRPQCRIGWIASVEGVKL